MDSAKWWLVSAPRMGVSANGTRNSNNADDSYYADDSNNADYADDSNNADYADDSYYANTGNNACARHDHGRNAENDC